MKSEELVPATTCAKSFFYPLYAWFARCFLSKPLRVLESVLSSLLTEKRGCRINSGGKVRTTSVCCTPTLRVGLIKNPRQTHPCFQLSQREETKSVRNRSSYASPAIRATQSACAVPRPGTAHQEPGRGKNTIAVCSGGSNSIVAVPSSGTPLSAAIEQGTRSVSMPTSVSVCFVVRCALRPIPRASSPNARKTHAHLRRIHGIPVS